MLLCIGLYNSLILGIRSDRLRGSIHEGLQTFQRNQWMCTRERRRRGHQLPKTASTDIIQTDFHSGLHRHDVSTWPPNRFSNISRPMHLLRRYAPRLHERILLLLLLLLLLKHRHSAQTRNISCYVHWYTAMPRGVVCHPHCIGCRDFGVKIEARKIQANNLVYAMHIHDQNECNAGSIKQQRKYFRRSTRFPPCFAVIFVATHLVLPPGDERLACTG